jgi:hypothetical protein
VVRGFLSWVSPKHNVNYESWTWKVSQISGCQSLIQCLVFSHLIFLSAHFPSRDSSYPLQAFSPLCHVQFFLIICFGSLLIWRWENNNNEDFFSPFSPCFACVCMCKGFVIWRWRTVTMRILFHLVFFLLCVCVCMHVFVVLWFEFGGDRVATFMYVCVHVHMRGCVCVLRFCVFGGRSTCACF